MPSLNIVPGAIDITTIDTSRINNDDSSNQIFSTNNNNQELAWVIVKINSYWSIYGVEKSYILVTASARMQDNG